MDISQIRNLLQEWFAPHNDRATMSAEEDYAEAEMALNALRSLFEQELHRRLEDDGPQGKARLD
jgi:hypothetical protein